MFFISNPLILEGCLITEAVDNQTYYMRLLLLLTITGSILISCSEEEKPFDKNQIKIIEDIVLGGDADTLFYDLRERGMKSGTFYTKGSLQSYDDANRCRIDFLYTDMFNFSKYRNSNIDLNHYGLLYPITLMGTNNTIGMNVLLVSTHQQHVFSPIKLGKPSIIQDVNGSLLNEIENLYTQKYGEPRSKSNVIFYPIYNLEGSDIKEYSYAGGDEGELVVWENDYMVVQFYKGYKSYQSSFDYKTPQYTYTWTYGGDPKVVEVEPGYEQTYSNAYIKYELKDTTVQILGLKNELSL